MDAQMHSDNFSTPGIHSSSYTVVVSRTHFQLCHKALTDLVPQSIRLQKDALAHEGYLEPATADHLATYMQPADVLLAATDQVNHIKTMGCHADLINACNVS